MAICFATVAGAAEVRQVTIGSTPGLDDTYSAGDRISVTVRFDAVVEVAGTPVLEIDVGGTARRAQMWMNAGSRVHFGYTVRAADNDPDGISINAGAIKLAGGRIDGPDGDAAALSLRGHTIANAPEHRVDGAGAWPPSIVSVSVTSNPGVDDTYSSGNVIEVTVEFDEPVFVEGLPTLAIEVGNESREAPYRDGSGSNRLTFTTRIWRGDLAAGGVVLPESGLAGGAAIRDADGNVAQTDYPAPGRQRRHRVDAVGPQVVGLSVVSRPPSGSVYREGDMVEIEVSFDEEVYLTGRASMPVGGLPQVESTQMGGGGERAAIAAESRQRSIVFRFNVLAQDETGRIFFGAGPLARPVRLAEQWPSIQDRAGNAASTEYSQANQWHDAPMDGSQADTTAPAVHSVTIASRPLGAAYGRGEALAVRVRFTEALQMSGGTWATTDLLLETGTKTLGTWIRSGATSATFTHLVTEADIDTDGVSLAGTVHVGPVEDAAGNAIDGESMAFTPFTDADHKVDGTRVAAARPRQVGSRLTFGGGQLSFDGMVMARGTPEFVVAGDRRVTRFDRPRHSFVDKDRSLWDIGYRFPGFAEDDFDFVGVQLPPEGWADVSFLDARGREVAVDSIALPRRFGPAIGSSFHGVVLEPPAHGGTRYGEGQTLTFHVVFTEPVNVGGAARLKVGVRELPCTPRNGRDRHFVCSRVIQAGENVTDLELARGAFRLLAISIRDDEGNVVSGDLSAYAETIEPFSVDTRVPRIEGVSIAAPAANGTFGAGAVVSVVVRFSEPVVATGSEQLAIVIGDDTRLASFDGNSGADGLRFSYVVSRADADANGLAIPADALRLEGGAITDRAGNEASLAHSAVGDSSTRRVDGSAPDISTTPVQIRVATAPAATLGSPSQAAKSSLTWTAMSTWGRQPRMSFAVEADRPDVLVGRASGFVRRGQSVTNNLRMPCRAGGTANVRLTIRVKSTRVPVAWDVLCRDGVIRVREVEVFQGPLAGRFTLQGGTGRVDAIANRQSVVRVHVEHESAATPPLAAGIHVAGVAAPLDAEYAGSMRRGRKWVSSYTMPLQGAQFVRGNGLDLVANPNAQLDADVIATPRLNFASLRPKTLSALKPVFVPIQVVDATPSVSADALLQVARSLLPIAGVSARVRTALVYELSAEERSGRQVDADRLFDRVVQLANEEGAADEFHIAVAAMPDGWESDAKHVYGGANQVVVGDTGLAELVAFGLGWGMGLRSVPCQALGDTAFPYAGIGAEGSYSFLEQRFIGASENYYDLMSGCAPHHISTYSYQKAVAWGDGASEAADRNGATMQVASNVGSNLGGGGQGGSPGAVGRKVSAAPAIVRSIALSGSVDEHGFWSLFAAATSTSVPRIDAPGDFVLTLHDDSGLEMYRQLLATADIGTSAGRAGAWAVRVPLQAREVHAVRIRNAGGSLLLDNDVRLPAGPHAEVR
ncbi:MAG: Ig-like domain-containing protein [Gammaproteobacteria bacterium]|nr:Ig-like domain-containing protein [Gammaproteobacteria bacterium]